MSNKSAKNDDDLSTVHVDKPHFVIRTAYDRVKNELTDPVVHFDPDNEPSLTKQSFVDECDINNIIAQFAKTGVLPGNTRDPGSALYGDFTSVLDYQTSMNLVINAHDAFLALPAAIRDRFHNDPEKLLAFLNDEKNRDEAVRLGLIDAPPAPEPDPVAPVAPPAGGDPQRPQTAGGGASPASA